MEKISPLISVIVPNYNHESYLKQRLDSIFKQCYPNFEVILLDDCSTDNSREILLEYANHNKVSHCVFNKKNSGNTFIQWNKGIQLAQGEFVWIAESDDFAEINFLDCVSKPMIEGSEVVLSYCQSNRVDSSSKVTGTWKNHTDDLDVKQFNTDFIMEGITFLERYLIYKNVIPNASAVLFRKNKYIEFQNFDKNTFLKYCGDWFLYFQMSLNGRIAFNSSILNNFRYHPQSVIANATSNGILSSTNNIEIKFRKEVQVSLSKFTNITTCDIRQINENIFIKLEYNRAIFLIKNFKKVHFLKLMTSFIIFFKTKYFYLMSKIKNRYT